MPHFVRCIEGHVFDATTSAICPTCGAIVETMAPAGEAPASANVTPQVAAATNSARTMPLLAALAALLFAGGAGTLIYALNRPGAPTAAPAVANSMSKEPDKTASRGNSAAPPPTAAPPSASGNNDLAQAPAAADQAPSTSVPSIQVPAQPSSGYVAANISDTLRTTLNVIHMFVIDVPNHYSEALSIAEDLIRRNNPMGMLAKAGILNEGLAGQLDPTQARALLKDAAHIGEPTSVGELAYYFERGVGGTRDINIANQLYVIAARAGAGGAEENIKRLHLEGDVGMTVIDAFHTLSDNNSSQQRVNDAIGALLGLGGITSARCAEALLAPLAEARDWKFIDRIAGAPIRSDQGKAWRLKTLQGGAVQNDPWCEWGLGQLASTGFPNYSKNLVEADVFYRLAAFNKRLAAFDPQIKRQQAEVENEMTPEEKAQTDSLFHSALPASMAP